jgi:hypothetical protein
MLAIRIFIGFTGAVLIMSLLGYAVTRDQRWFRIAALTLKVAFALVLLLLLSLLLERILMVV